MKVTKPVALQLYSLRNEMNKDFYGTLEQVGQMGYDGVEFCGFYDQPAEKVKDALDKFGLKAVSTHIGINAWKNDYALWADYFREIGCNYTTVPYEQAEFAPNGEHYEERIDEYIEIGRKLKEELGINLCYHNHAFEFQMYNGEYGLDYLFKKAGADVLNPELDVCWIKVSGEDPIEYIKKYKGRTKMLHLKDFTILPTADPEKIYFTENGRKKIRVDAEGFEFRPVGEGCQNMKGIIRTAEECGVEWLIVEQDISKDNPPIVDAKKGIDFMLSVEF